MVLVGEPPTHHLFGDQQCQIGGLRANLLDGLATLMFDLASGLGFDPLRIRLESLFIFLKQTLCPFLRLGHDRFGLSRRCVQLGLILLQLAFGL